MQELGAIDARHQCLRRQFVTVVTGNVEQPLS